MQKHEIEPAIFKEHDPDTYVLTTEADGALEAAWLVLQAIESHKDDSSSRFYDDATKEDTLEYLRDGGEERPLGGIFAVEVDESAHEDGKVDLFVSNRNGRHDERYRGILRDVVQVVGVEGSASAAS